MKKKNILFLMMSLNVGGTEKHVFDLISHLNEEKFNPVICCIYNLGQIGMKLSKNKKGIKIYKDIARNKWDISCLWKLFNIIKKENIDILYTIDTPLSQFWGSISAKFGGVTANITRVSMTNPTFHAGRRKLINRIMMPSVDKVIAQAYSQKEYLVNIEKIDAEKIEVIHNGVDLIKFRKSKDELALKESIGIPEDARVVGMVARLSSEKGYPVFLNTAKIILNKMPDVHFLIVGDGVEKENLKKITGRLQIESNIHFLGTVENVPQVVSIFDVAVMSSDFDTFSNSILEYMAMSKPVVATNVGSFFEVVRQDVNGYLLQPGDPEGLAESVLKLLDDKNLAVQLGKAGRKIVEEEFSIQKMVETYEVLFEGVVKQNARHLIMP